MSTPSGGDRPLDRPLPFFSIVPASGARSVSAALRECYGDPLRMRELRLLLGEWASPHAIQQMDDREVLAFAGRLADAGRLQFGPLSQWGELDAIRDEAGKVVGGWTQLTQGTPAEAAADDKPAPAPAPAPAAAAPVSEPPTLAPAVDGPAMAASLKAAAASGVPFCEICERKRAA